MMLPMFPASLVPRAKMTVRGAQTPFVTSFAELPVVYVVVLLARRLMPWMGPPKAVATRNSRVVNVFMLKESLNGMRRKDN